jgi:DNA-binding transcriptional ArsR family regulator
MADLDFIAPQKTTTVTVSVESTYNALSTLSLLLEADERLGFSDWTVATAAALPPEVMRTNHIVVGALNVAVHLDGIDWPSFPAWVDNLAKRDPTAMRDLSMKELVEKAHRLYEELEVEEGDIPDLEELLADRELYLGLIQQIYCWKGMEEDMELSHYEEAHALLQDPTAMQKIMVSHLRWAWDQVLAADWERNLPMLQESVEAYGSIDYSGRPFLEVFQLITGREIPAPWTEWGEKATNVIFIPSAHIGPYLFLIYMDDASARVVFGARVPEGATVRSPALTRSELLMRLSALADDTRLRILELLAQRDEMRAPDIMAELDLSQSSAWRHLTQLTATGFLIARRCEGAKCFTLNHDRIDATFEALKKFLE